MESQTSRPLLVAACRRVLRPIVRLLLKSGWTWREFADLAKAVFVEVATREYGKRGRPANASRVAIVTGLNRRDVARLRERLEEDAAAPAYLSPGSRVLSGWHQDPDFLDTAGSPAVLAPEGADGRPGFAELVRRYAPDLPVVAMLKELKAAGAVEVTPAGVRALMRAYVPRGLDANKVRLWGTALGDLGSTLEHNLTRDDGVPARFERAAIEVAVDARALPAFRAFLEREGQAFLERVDEFLTTHSATTTDASAPAQGQRRVRLGAGVYQIEND